MKNNSPEQKLAWQEMRGVSLGSQFSGSYPSGAWKKYRDNNPKPPSRVDRHRMAVAARKAGK